MNSNTRIAKAFDCAPKIQINNKSKIVLISDCHRGTGDLNDNFSNNENTYFHALSCYFDLGFTYIELGDGDELWENKKFEGITDTHSHIFWLLNRFYEKKRLYLIYGNHDVVKKKKKWRDCNLAGYYDERCKKCMPLFPNPSVHEGIILEHTESQKKLYLLHGHQADFFNDRLWRLSRFLVRNLWRPLELVGIKNPTGTSESRKKKDIVEKKLMNYAKKIDSILVAGHTHRPVFPKPGEPLYFNDGCCVHPRCITAIEIENGNISLVKWSVKAKEDGTLSICKDFLEGPVSIGAFFEASCGVDNDLKRPECCTP